MCATCYAGNCDYSWQSDSIGRNCGERSKYTDNNYLGLSPADAETIMSGANRDVSTLANSIKLADDARNNLLNPTNIDAADAATEKAFYSLQRFYQQQFYQQQLERQQRAIERQQRQQQRQWEKQQNNYSYPSPYLHY